MKTNVIRTNLKFDSNERIEYDLVNSQDLIIKVYILEGWEISSSEGFFGKEYPNCYLKL